MHKNSLKYHCYRLIKKENGSWDEKALEFKKRPGEADCSRVLSKEEEKKDDCPDCGLVPSLHWIRVTLK